MKCTRCGKKLDYDYFWHIPICGKCRGEMISKRDFALTEKETEIMEKRLKKEESHE